MTETNTGTVTIDAAENATHRPKSTEPPTSRFGKWLQNAREKRAAKRRAEMLLTQKENIAFIQAENAIGIASLLRAELSGLFTEYGDLKHGVQTRDVNRILALAQASAECRKCIDFH